MQVLRGLKTGLSLLELHPFILAKKLANFDNQQYIPNPNVLLKNNRLKHLFFILISLLLFASVQGQKPKIQNYSTHDDHPIHFGFCLGLNTMDFIVKPNYQTFLKDTVLADVSSPSVGFHIQIVSNYRLGEYFDLRFLPGISFGQRDLNFFKKDKLIEHGKQKLESNFLEFPLLLKYKGKRLNNVRPYLVSGINCRYDLAKTFSEDNDIFLDLKDFDFYYEAGTGLDFYLQYFKLSTEFKVSYGFRNVLKSRNSSNLQFQSSIDWLNSMLFMVSFFFE
jgi:hypothetical protein